jgi:hypothetical protein
MERKGGRKKRNFKRSERRSKRGNFRDRQSEVRRSKGETIQKLFGENR